MKKTLKWVGIVVGALLVLDFISYLFEEEEEPIAETCEMEIKESEVYGPNKDVFSVVPGKYTLHYDKGKVFVKVKLELQEPVDPDLKVEGPSLILKDENGMNVTGSDYGSTLSLSDSEMNKLISFLQGDPYDTQEVIFSDSYDRDTRTMMTSSRAFTIEDLQLIDPKEEEAKKAAEKMKSLGDVLDDAVKEVKDDKEVKETMDDVEKALELSEGMFELSKKAIELSKEVEKMQ